MLNVGVLVDSKRVSKYVQEFTEWAQRQPDLRVTTLLVNAEHAGNAPRVGVLNALRRWTFSLVTRTESMWLWRLGTSRDHFDERDLAERLPQIVAVRSSPEHLRGLNLDIVLCLTGSDPAREMLDVPRLGMLSLRYGDDATVSGRPPGFWEVYLRQDHTGFAIRWFESGSDCPITVFRGRFATRHFFLLNQASLYTMAHLYLRTVLAGIAASGSAPRAVDAWPYFNVRYDMPGLAQQTRYVAALARGLVLNRYSRARDHDFRWQVAFSRCAWQQLAVPDAHEIPNPPNRYLGDPFVISVDTGDYLFVEDFDYKTDKGRIAVYELHDTTATHAGIVLDEPFHMSFPYLFRFDGKLYMCPETSAAGDIRIYECVTFPLEWKLAKIVMSNLSAVDTMIFAHGGRWWLFTTVSREGTVDHCSELCVFYSDSPLGDKWHPHPKNPIVVDASIGRNAGMVSDAKWLYRVAQRQGFDAYGKGFSINRIVILDPEEYIEAQVCAVSANFYSGLRGTHHLHSNGRVSAFDFVRKMSKTS